MITMRRISSILKQPAMLFVFLTGTWGSIYAQQKISGKVIDENKLPVEYAAFSLESAEGAKVIKGGLIDDKGYFTVIAPKGNYNLVIIAMGYKKYSQPAQLTDSVLKLKDVVLVHETNNLNQVSITAKKALIEQRPDRMIMNVGNSVLAAGNDALSILSMAPHVQVVNGNIQMMGKSNVLILLNGKRLPGATLENILAGIPGDQIERIEVISSPSSKYDASASGGVIEIYTKQSKGSGWNANVGGNFAQGKKSGGGATGGLILSSGKIDVSLSGSYARRDNIQSGNAGRLLFMGLKQVGDLQQNIDFPENKVKNGSFNGNLTYRIDPKHALGVSVDVVSSSMKGTGTINTIVNDNGNKTISNSVNSPDIKSDFYNYNLFYKETFDKQGSNLLIATNYARFTKDQNQYFNNNLTNEDTGVATTAIFRNFAPSNYNIYTESADYTKIWTTDTRLEAGLKYTYTDNQSQQVTEVLSDGTFTAAADNVFAHLGYQEHITAGYANFNHKIGNFSFQAGLRMEDTKYKVKNGIDSSYFNVFPNARIDYKVSKNYTASVGYQENINRPSYENLIPYELFIDNYTSTRGNAFLRPEYAHTFFWNNQYRSYNLKFSFTKTDDAISYVYFYDQNTKVLTSTQENFRNNYLGSASLTAPVRIAPWWQSTNSVNLLYQTLDFSNPANVNVTIRKDKFYYTASTLNVFDFNSSWSAEISAFYGSPTFTGEFDLGGVSNVSAGIKRTFFNKKAFLKFDVSDIFYESNRRISTDLAPIVNYMYYKMDTRRARLTFRYTFGKTTVTSKKGAGSNNSDAQQRLGI